jgi:predicted permease
MPDSRKTARIGNVRLTKEQVRDVRGGHRLESLVQDVQYACRSLVRSPGVTAAVVLMLAFGIGANAAMCGLLSRLFLQAPPHIDNPGAVYRLNVRQVGFLGGQPFISGSMDWEEFIAIRDDADHFSEVAGYTYPSPTQHGQGQAAEELQVSLVTGEFFRLLGVRSARGRLIGPNDDRLEASPVAVIGERYWRRRFGSERPALGEAVTFDNITYTIVGVTPPGFSGPDPSAADVWLPVHHAATASRGDRWRRSGNGFALRPLVRLAPGTTEESAAAATTTAVRRVRTGSALRRDTLATVLLGPIVVARGPSTLNADMRLPLVVGGLAAVVLLIAAANAANLLMLRAIVRRRELAVRSALGATGWRVGRLLVLESLVLAVTSGALALAVAAASGRILRATLLPRHHWASDPVDNTVLLFAGLTAVTIGLAAGLTSALVAARHGGLSELRGSVRVARAVRSPIRSTLLVFQSALSLMLLIGAMLFYRSFDAARQVDIGYAREHLLTVVLDEISFQRPTPRSEVVIRMMEDRVRALPGVVDVAQGNEHAAGWAPVARDACPWTRGVAAYGRSVRELRDAQLF